MKARQWTLSTQRDEGYTIRLHEAAPWVDVLEWLAVALPCPHRLDQFRVFQWLWKVPFGKPQREDDGWLINSVMSRLLDAEGWVLDRFDRKWRLVQVIPVSEETARQINPEFVSIFDDEESK